MSRMKVEIEKFNWRNNFGSWSVKMLALLTIKDLAKILDRNNKLLERRTEADKDELKKRVYSIILLKVLREVTEKEDAKAL